MKKDLLSEKEVSNLIIKILTDQASPDECLVLDKWVKKSDENRLFFLHFRNIWMASSQVIKAEKTNIPKALEIVNHKINEINPDEVRLNGKKVFPGRKSNLFSYVRIAALWVLIFGMGALFSMLFLKPEKILNFNSAVSVITPRGSKALTVLPDGSVVWLNAGSRIEYKITKNNAVREVTIDGEAYFKVSKDPGHPFIVNAEEMIIKAYGTEFNVKAYHEDKVVETTLVDGSVSVEIKNKTSNKTVLKPDEQAIYYKPTAEQFENFLVTKGIDPALYTLWINDRLQIKGETLEGLSIMLERKYDVTIHFDDNFLKGLRFTGIIENETIEQILELIKISSNVDYKIEGREIWLSKTRK
ncbi:MAG: FecR family protein [Bacteroidales bacterium]|nr:FecR family protein [Bacteroidales bacterium]